MSQPNRQQSADQESSRVTNSKPIPHIPLPFKEVIADALKMKPPPKDAQPKPKRRSRHDKEST
jgi:hypothetical protein